MAVTEADILRGEQERSSLLRAISDIENTMANSKPENRRVLENTVENAKKRVATLEKKIEEAKIEREAEVRAETATAALAAKETRLSADEKETYRGFLERSYFTKKDFGKLDQFYAHSYDRLSEDGKEEMSKRIHEGIKRGEFKETDLPESVLKRDAKLYRGRASNADKRHSTQNEAGTAMTGDGMAAKPSSPPKSDIDFSSVDLKGIQLVAAPSEPTSASIPNASVRDARTRS